jgi:predicted acylesterase/phospholipase RssA
MLSLSPGSATALAAQVEHVGDQNDDDDQQDLDHGASLPGTQGILPVTDAQLMILRAGPGALDHLRRNGLAPGDVAAIPAAAGGPKGLALLPLDRLLSREWLQPSGPAIELLGASVGAWRMAALAQPDPLAALDRLQHAYVHDQNYAGEPTPGEVATACRRIAGAVLGGRPLAIRDGLSLTVITSRARGPLQRQESKLAFARATLSNALARERLAAHLERVLFVAGAPGFMNEPFDAFGLVRVALEARNAEDALLASGTIPLLCSPVRDIAGAPPGNYWDGALVDYHLLLPYPRLKRAGQRRRIVLYPHFNDYVTPGWLDKHLPWRRSPRGHPWLEDMLLVAPSPAFLARLPNGKLPDRQDFYRYGPDHAARIRDWERAIGECGRFAEAVMRWLERPDPSLVLPI